GHEQCPLPGDEDRSLPAAVVAEARSGACPTGPQHSRIDAYVTRPTRKPAGVLHRQPALRGGPDQPGAFGGGVIAERAKALGRPMTVLLEAADVEHLRKPVDFARIDHSVNAATIEFLLDARQRVGPIGAYSEGLYRERKGEELESFVQTMREHGVPESQTYLDAEAAREMLLARLPAAMRSPQSDDSAFCLLPIGMLTGPKSILATLRDRGGHPTPAG